MSNFRSRAVTTPRGFADSNVDERSAKARKIEHLLGQYVDLANADCLDLGAGSGILSRHFSTCTKTLIAADRSDEKFAIADVPFVIIEGDQLPFQDASFDAVIFNHVIEHVGDRSAQDVIMREIARILRPAGVLYIAVPNKFAPVEPHYRLPLLGALPRPLANLLVRRSGKGSHYDCFPLTGGELRRLVNRHFRHSRNVTADAFDHFVANEMRPNFVRTATRAFPARWVRWGSAALPTQMMVASKAPLAQQS